MKKYSHVNAPLWKFASFVSGPFPVMSCVHSTVDMFESSCAKGAHDVDRQTELRGNSHDEGALASVLHVQSSCVYSFCCILLMSSSHLILSLHPFMSGSHRIHFNFFSWANGLIIWCFCRFGYSRQVVPSKPNWENLLVKLHEATKQ